MIKPEVKRCWKSFYRKNIAKGKAYTLEHFHKFEYLLKVIHHVMKLVHAGETVELRKGQGGRENIPELIKANIAILCWEQPMVAPYTNFF
mgnify:CR=1 FL=1